MKIFLESLKKNFQTRGLVEDHLCAPINVKSFESVIEQYKITVKKYLNCAKKHQIKMKLKKLAVRKKSISPNLDTLDDFNDDEICSHGNVLKKLSEILVWKLMCS